MRLANASVSLICNLSCGFLDCYHRLCYLETWLDCWRITNRTKTSFSSQTSLRLLRRFVWESFAVESPSIKNHFDHLNYRALNKGQLTKIRRKEADNKHLHPARCVLSNPGNVWRNRSTVEKKVNEIPTQETRIS